MQECEKQSEVATETSTSQSGLSVKFTLFPRLPTELRLKIWEQAIPDRRIVRLRVSSDRPSHFFGLSQDTPAIISASDEACLVALNYYVPIRVAMQRILFNFDREILYFLDEAAVELFFRMTPPAELMIARREIRHIMWPVVIPITSRIILLLSAEFMGLESFTCVIRDYKILPDNERDKLRNLFGEQFRVFQASSRYPVSIPPILFRDLEEIRSLFNKDT
jgi:hypothetical protein